MGTPAAWRRVLIWALVVASLIGGGAVLWKRVIRDRVWPKRFGVVEEGLVFRSGQINEGLVESTLRDRGIKVIVDLAGDDTADSRAEDAAARKLGIEQRLLPLAGDGTGDIGAYVQAIGAIAQARREGEPVLVHCVAGGSRTGAVVAMYRMLVEGWTPQRALDEMQSYGWRAKDSALADYLNAHAKELASKLAADGVIDRVPDPLPRFPMTAPR